MPHKITKLELGVGVGGEVGERGRASYRIRARRRARVSVRVMTSPMR